MTILKWVSIVIVLVLLLAILVPVVVTQVENKQAQANRERLEQPLPESQAPVAAIAFSRSGNTAVLSSVLPDEPERFCRPSA